MQKPVVTLANYQTKYDTIKFSREDGILTMQLHHNNGPYRMGGVQHAELVDAFYNVSADHQNRVVILTGTGDQFCAGIDANFVLDSPDDVARINYEGRPHHAGGAGCRSTHDRRHQRSHGLDAALRPHLRHHIMRRACDVLRPRPLRRRQRRPRRWRQRGLAISLGAQSRAALPASGPDPVRTGSAEPWRGRRRAPGQCAHGARHGDRTGIHTRKRNQRYAIPALF